MSEAKKKLLGLFRSVTSLGKGDREGVCSTAIS